MAIILEPSAYGALPGAVDNTTALNAWFAAVMSTAGAVGQISDAYQYATPLVWDFAPRRWGVKITMDRGCGPLQYTGTSISPALQMIVSGGTGTSNIKDCAGFAIDGIDLTCDTGGIALQIGKNDGSDVFQSSQFSGFRIINLNSAGATGAVGCRIVGMNTSQWDVPIFNVKPATSAYVGGGVALQICHMTSTTFNSPSPSNANIGIQYSNLGNTAIGFTHGNTFNCPDIENVQYGVYGDSGPYAWETYRGGNLDMTHTGGYGVTSKAGFFGGTYYPNALTFECPPNSFTVNPSFHAGVKVLT